MTGVLAMGDYGHQRCGVGSSLAALTASLATSAGDPPIAVLDTGAPGLRAFARAARASARSGATCVMEYPTASTVLQPDLVVRAVLLRALFGRRRLRLHLHEFRHLRRLLRWPVKFAALLPSRVVVSNDAERAALRAALGGLVGRVTEVVVAPPTNGTAPTDAEVAAALVDVPDRARVVGVFGMRRPDKGLDWLVDVLGRLDPRFDRLVLAGAGWDGMEWPAALRARYEIEVLGHVDRRDLPAMFASWGLAVAPLWEPAQDGRMSLRTPLAYGVPTISVGPATGALTLRPRHLLLVPPADPSSIPGAVDRAGGAADVAAFERATADALAAALFA